LLSRRATGRVCGNDFLFTASVKELPLDIDDLVDQNDTEFPFKQFAPDGFEHHGRALGDREFSIEFVEMLKHSGVAFLHVVAVIPFFFLVMKKSNDENFVRFGQISTICFAS
jgi:hypothetical protein